MYDFTATAVHYSNADSLAELSNYDVVVHGGLYYDAMSPQYYAALRDYVEADAGGVVTTGLYGYTMRNYLSGQSRADADFVSPVACGTVNASYGYETNRTLLFDTEHAITDGVASATVSGWSYYSANLLDADAVSLGTNPGAFSGSFYQGYTAAYSESDGLGNRAYLGGEYAQNWDGGGSAFRRTSTSFSIRRSTGRPKAAAPTRIRRSPSPVSPLPMWTRAAIRSKLA